MMKLLFFKSNIFMQEDWLETLQRAGYDVDPITYVFTDYMEDSFLKENSEKDCRRSPMMLWYPLISTR